MSSAGSTQPAPLSAADQKRFEELFQKLDKNLDGKIEARELAESLKALHGITDVDKHAQVRKLKFASHVSLSIHRRSQDFQRVGAPRGGSRFQDFWLGEDGGAEGPERGALGTKRRSAEGSGV